jgi:uncharacterized protein YegL
MTVDYSGNANQRTPCVLILDASGSMTTTGSRGKTRIQELNEGIKTLEEALKSDDAAISRVQLGIVSVGGPSNSAEVLMDWTDVENFEAFPLTADGTTPLGTGVRLGLKMIEQIKTDLKTNGINYTRPWMMIITDGEPTDSDSEWNEYVYLPLLAAKRKSEELGNKSGGGSGSGSGGGMWGGISGIFGNIKQKINKITSDKEWYKYPCIPTNPQAKPSQMSNGSTVFIIGQEVFYNNGRKKKADGTMANYVCPSSGGGNVAPKTTTTVTKKSTGTGTGTGVVAQSNVKQVQKLVGVAETGVFDTATAKAVRTKLGA